MATRKPQSKDIKVRVMQLMGNSEHGFREVYELDPKKARELILKGEVMQL